MVLHLADISQMSSKLVRIAPSSRGAHSIPRIGFKSRQTPNFGMPYARKPYRPIRPLRVNNGSPARASECPVLGEEQTSILGSWRSAYSQERSFKILLKCAKLLLDLRIDSEPRWT